MASIQRKLSFPDPERVPKPEWLPPMEIDRCKHDYTSHHYVTKFPPHPIPPCPPAPNSPLSHSPSPIHKHLQGATESPPRPPPPCLSTPSPPLSHSSSWNHKHLPSYLISLGFAFGFLLLIALFLWRRYHRNSRENDENWPATENEGLGANGSGHHHHAWLINTMGLQQSTIDSIAVCKYKTGEGLIEGTECSVCLSEFQEDESLRLLPKCSHAFHLSCIDPWLRSHKNCPLCRAPVVEDGISRDIEPNSNDSAWVEETQMENLENNTRSSEIVVDVSVSSDENGGEGGGQQVRNSISVQENEEGSGEETQVVVVEAEGFDLNSEVVEKKKKKKKKKKTQRSENSGSLCCDLMKSSSQGRRSLQMGPVSMKRSFSSGRLLFVSRQNKRLCHTPSSPLPV